MRRDLHDFNVMILACFGNLLGQMSDHFLPNKGQVVSEARAATRLQEKKGDLRPWGRKNTRAGYKAEFTKFKLVTVILRAWRAGSMPGGVLGYS